VAFQSEMIKPNPFSPKSGQEPKVFIDRDKEIDLFLKKIDEAKTGKTNHYIINGGWGSGKSCLLMYFRLLAQNNKSTACYFQAREISESASDMEIIMHVVESIIRNMPFELFKKNSSFAKYVNGIGLQILGFGFNISFGFDKNRVIDPQIFFMDSLINIWKDVGKKTSALIVLIDDVHNIKAKRFFTTLKNTLSDTKIIDSTRVLFVLSSTIEEWKPFMKTNHPIGRFFIPRVELRNLDKTSTVSLVKKIIKDTGVVFTDNIISKIYSYTNGHLFQIHSLGMALYNNEINGKVGDREWSRGFEEALSYLGGIIYEGQIQTMSDNEVKVYRSMNAFRRNNIGSIRKKIRIKGLNEYLRRLVEKRFLTVPKRGEYVILDKMLWEYLQRK